MKNLNILFTLAAVTTITLAALSVPATAKAHNHRMLVAGKKHHSRFNKQLNPASAAVFSPGKTHAHHAEAPSKSKRYAYNPEASPPAEVEFSVPPEPYPGLYNYARRCIENHLTEDCGKEIFVGLFESLPDSSEKCCWELLGMGKDCHNAILKTTLSLPMMITEKKEAMKRSAELWSQCAFITDTFNLSPLPLI